MVELSKVYEYLQNIESQEYYGKLYFTFQNGKIVNIKLEGSLDLDQFRSEAE